MLKTTADGRTRARVRANGVDWRASFDNQADAAVWEAIAARAAAAGQAKPEADAVNSAAPGQPGVTTLDGALDHAYRTRWITLEDGERIRDRALWCIRELGLERPVASLTAADIDLLGVALDQRGVADSTANKHLAAMGGLLAQAERANMIANPPRIKYRQRNSPRHRCMTVEEERQQLAELELLDPRFRALTELMTDTGIRTPSEVDRARVEHRSVHDLGEDGTRFAVTVEGSKSRKKGDGGERVRPKRLLPLTDRANAAFDVLADGREEGKLFEPPPHAFKRAWAAARERIGLAGDKNFVPYVCRHTFATRHANVLRTPLPVLQRLLGHSSLKQTAEYVVVDESDLWAAIPSNSSC